MLHRIMHNVSILSQRPINGGWAGAPPPPPPACALCVCSPRGVVYVGNFAVPGAWGWVLALSWPLGVGLGVAGALSAAVTPWAVCPPYAWQVYRVGVQSWQQRTRSGIKNHHYHYQCFNVDELGRIACLSPVSFASAFPVPWFDHWLRRPRRPRRSARCCRVPCWPCR